MSSDSADTDTSFDNFPYHLRVGVSGHRNLANAEVAKAAVARAFETIDHALQPQSRTPLKWAVVSPLAKGADRIVAEVALQQQSARLEVLTPLAVDEYRKDFEEEEDRQEFEELLKRADSVHALSKEILADDPTSEAPSRWRNRQYLKGGRAVVDACEILIVVWNGQPAEGTGGTGEIVRYALQKQRTVIWIPTQADTPEPCLLTEWPTDEEPVAQKLPAHAKGISLGYHQLNAYNRDATIKQADLQASVVSESRTFGENAKQAGLPEEAVEPIIKTILPVYARANALAVRYRDLYLSATVGLFNLSATAVTVVVGQVLFFPDQLWLVAFEILAMAIAIGLWLWSRQAAWHEKWIHDRYLAEQLRVASYAMLVDEASASPREASPTDSFYRGPREWLFRSVADLREQVRAGGSPAVELEAAKQFLIEFWLEDQRDYHARNSRKKKRSVHRGHRTGMILFLLTLVMAVLHLLGVGHAEHHGHASPLIAVDVWITFLAIILPVWGAAIHAIINQLELDRIGSRSAQMATLLGELVQRAHEAETFEELRDIIQEAERVMSLETHDWWILVSFREPVLPA